MRIKKTIGQVVLVDWSNTKFFKLPSCMADSKENNLRDLESQRENAPARSLQQFSQFVSLLRLAKKKTPTPTPQAFAVVRAHGVGNLKKIVWVGQEISTEMVNGQVFPTEYKCFIFKFEGFWRYRIHFGSEEKGFKVYFLNLG